MRRLVEDAPREFFRITLWKPVVDEGARMSRERWRRHLEAQGIETFEAKSGGMRALFRKGQELDTTPVPEDLDRG